MQHVVRIPEVQKERLVQLVQNNFRKAFGPFAGSNGKSLKSQLWKKMAEELNTLGPPRTPDQWKAVMLSPFVAHDIHLRVKIMFHYRYQNSISDFFRCR